MLFYVSGKILRKVLKMIGLLDGEVRLMGISYNGLWKLLIDKNMKKMDLVDQVGISSSTLAKLSKGDAVSLTVLQKICDKLDCDFGDIISYDRQKAGDKNEL